MEISYMEVVYIKVVCMGVSYVLFAYKWGVYIDIFKNGFRRITVTNKNLN
jgi:hypothetical protein